MQRQMEEKQKELEAKDYTVTAGGGAVELVISGANEVKSLTIKPEAVDPDDVEMLQDLLVAAMNEALRTVASDKQATMGNLAGGLGF